MMPNTVGTACSSLRRMKRPTISGSALDPPLLDVPPRSGAERLRVDLDPDLPVLLLRDLERRLDHGAAGAPLDADADRLSVRPTVEAVGAHRRAGGFDELLRLRRVVRVLVDALLVVGPVQRDRKAVHALAEAEEHLVDE